VFENAPPGANAYMQYGGMFKKAHPMSPSDPAGMMHHNENFMVVILLLGIVARAIAVVLERPKPRVDYHDEPQIKSKRLSYRSIISKKRD
jgi:hypothetical protein